MDFKLLGPRPYWWSLSLDWTGGTGVPLVGGWGAGAENRPRLLRAGKRLVPQKCNSSEAQGRGHEEVPYS